MININNVPTVFNEAGRNSKFVAIDALKDIHVSFSGYGLAEGEQFTFPTKEQLDANPKKYIKVLDTYRGSNNKGALILGEDGKGRTRWFNLSTLTRTCNNSDGVREQIDDFRAEMNSMNDDSERVAYLLGKTIKGTGTISAYARDFDRDTRKPLDTYSPADFVTIEIVEAKPAKPARA